MVVHEVCCSSPCFLKNAHSSRYRMKWLGILFLCKTGRRGLRRPTCENSGRPDGFTPNSPLCQQLHGSTLGIARIRLKQRNYASNYGRRNAVFPRHLVALWHVAHTANIDAKKPAAGEKKGQKEPMAFQPCQGRWC